jgi:hypothetical protein
MLDEIPNFGREMQIPLYVPVPPPGWKPNGRESTSDLEEKVLIIDPLQREDEGSNRGVVIIDLYDSCEDEYIL